MTPAYVIKPEELAVLNYLAPGHPRPQAIEWINRGTDQKMRPTSVDMLLRTLFEETPSPSVVRLRQSAGLRVIFGTDKDRDQFAAAFAAARNRETSEKPHLVSAIFNDRDHAEQAIERLKEAGVADGAISILWRASQFIDADHKWREGHSKLSVASAIAGGGIAGAMLGVAVLVLPGIGPIAAAGAIAASAFSEVAAVSAAIGATGGAIARMLTDHDVDGVSATYYEQQIQRGKIFVSVDLRVAEGMEDIARQVLTQSGGSSTAPGNAPASLSGAGMDAG
jgi:hypothetical protein